MNEQTTMSIEQVRKAIADARRMVGQKADERQRLNSKRMDVAAWVRGHENMTPENLKMRMLDGTLNDRKVELDEITQKLFTINEEIDALNNDIGELLAIKFSSDDVLQFAVKNYKLALQRSASAKDENQAFLTRKEQAEKELPWAKSGLSSAQNRKAKALTTEDMAAACDALDSAQSRVGMLEQVLGNIKAAEPRTREAVNKAESAVGEAKKEVWKAYCDLSLEELKTTQGFAQVAEALEVAYAAWAGAGNVHDFGRFVRNAVLGEGMHNPADDRVAAAQDEVWSALMR